MRCRGSRWRRMAARDRLYTARRVTSRSLPAQGTCGSRHGGLSELESHWQGAEGVPAACLKRAGKEHRMTEARRRARPRLHAPRMVTVNGITTGDLAGLWPLLGLLIEPRRLLQGASRWPPVLRVPGRPGRGPAGGTGCGQCCPRGSRPLCRGGSGCRAGWRGTPEPPGVPGRRRCRGLPGACRVGRRSGGRPRPSSCAGGHGRRTGGRTGCARCRGGRCCSGRSPPGPGPGILPRGGAAHLLVPTVPVRLGLVGSRVGRVSEREAVLGVNHWPLPRFSCLPGWLGPACRRW